MCTAPGNLVFNPSFECGTSGWVVPDVPPGGTFAESSEAHSGFKSVVLSSTRASGTMVVNLFSQNAPVNQVGERVFCARAWMKGSTSSGRLTLRKVKQSTVTDVSFSTPITSDWTVVPPPDTGPLVVDGDGEDQILVRIAMLDAGVGDKLFVDDVLVFESADGGCK